MSNRYLALKGKDKFDISKVTVVGSPTITDGGIASGFSTENYLTGKTGITLGNNFVIDCEFSTGEDVTSYQGLLRLQSASGFLASISNRSGSSSLVCSFVGLVGDVKIIPEMKSNTSYRIQIKCEDGLLKTYCSENNASLLQVDEISDINLTESNTSMFMGNNSSAYYWQGSIDLKEFKIYVDNKLVYSPAIPTCLLERRKEGYDPSKFTIVGSPTITSDGVASGFLIDTTTGYDASPNCIRPVGFTLGQLKNKPWKMECSFVLPTETAPTNKILYSLGQTRRWEGWSNSLSYSVSRKVAIISNFGTDTDYTGDVDIIRGIDYATIGMVLGNSYTYITDFDGNSIYTYKIKDNETGKILKEWTYVPATGDKNLYTVNLYPNETINIGTGNSTYSTQYSGWMGSIDLPSFSITVDGKEVFTGAKEVFYALRM